MLEVFFTVDVEVWCDGWQDIDAKFPRCFERDVYGPTAKGRYGLPYTLQVLADHGLPGVFFVEALFSRRFGQSPLTEILGLIRDAGQEIQLHLHTEWVDEAREPLLPGPQAKRQHLRHFSLEEQTHLIATGRQIMEEAGGGLANAFRAGSFGFNRDTLRALAANAMPFDSSYNGSMMGQDSGVAPGTVLVEPVVCEGVAEFPMTVYHDSARSLRHAQLTACSWLEIEGLLWQALEAGRRSFVMLSHNFELLNAARNRPDRIVVDRLHRLCAFLDRHRDSFHVRGFRDLAPIDVPVQPPPLSSPLWKSGARLLEQVYRRRYG